MNFWKKIKSYNWFIQITSWITWKYVSLIYYTNTWKIKRHNIPQSYHNQKKPFILAFWHSRLMLACYAWQKNKNINILISEHTDGKIISFAISYYGIKTIKGSRTRHGTQALRKMLLILKKGELVGITPDGPNGPKEKVSQGICQIARLSKCDIIPLGFSTSRHYRLKTWDNFFFSLPFGNGTFIWGNPIPIENNINKLQKNLEKELNYITNIAEKII